MQVNPNEWKTEDNQEKRVMHAGRKIMCPIAVGFKEHYDKRVLEITSIVILDLEVGSDGYNSNDVGLITSDRFYLTENAMWKVGKWAAAMGCETPFDPERLDDIVGIISSGKVFKATFEEREYNDKTYLNIKYYNFARVSKVTDEQKERVSKAQESVRKMLDKRVEWGDVYHAMKILNPLVAQQSSDNAKTTSGNSAGGNNGKPWEELPF